MMHMVITNAWKGAPYPIDTLMMFMANMSWNSAMNTSGVIDMLTDTDPETGEDKIPRIIYSDAFHSEMVAYADQILPDTTYLERPFCSRGKARRPNRRKANTTLSAPMRAQAGKLNDGKMWSCVYWTRDTQP